MPKIVDFDERRLELADATARLIARGGLGAATMRDVATEAGLTTGSVTHYFADKRELLLFTLNASLQRRRGRRDMPSAGERRQKRCARRCSGALPVERRSPPPLDGHHRVLRARRRRRGAGRGAAHCLPRVPRLGDAATGGVGFAVGRCAREAERLIALVDGVAMQALFDEESWPAAQAIGDARAVR